jgi:hypothetical protein
MTAITMEVFMLDDCKYFQIKKAVVYSYEDEITPKTTRDFAFCTKALKSAVPPKGYPSAAHLSAKDLSEAIAKMEAHLSAGMSDEALLKAEIPAKPKASDPCPYYMTNMNPGKECPFYREKNII